ncbi:alpha-(1-_3)-arabinofuranosyltransferase [Nocardioides sp. URHA0020]|uniref:alpha-(1->3)-arabinofuranosyltransferase n=1 Tax=Nocardioides sp. URHA0020 TaxID=1380392 RepID=UPI000687393F|nr:alpha-(1->3)-arabinofuranosyltransferase [Nocardioides sp. URHA0020]
MASASAADRLTWRYRLGACSLVLVAVAFSQRPGQLVGDTKLDLVVNPAGLLARSLHLWDPQGGFGQVQNQAYGYLFPMGPFFWLGDLLSMPGWVVQRLWWSLLLVVAFLGIVKLAGALGLGSPTSRLVAGFAYALSPRILTVIGPISVEAWPSALAPWVLVPLVLGASRGSPRRAALLSALAVAVVGGVNAAATFAVIPLGALWLLTREPGPRRRSMMIWWPAFVALGTAWWLVPLLLLGRYSPPFLDYIETSAVTTVPTTLFDSLRGTSHWVPYVEPTWQAGNDIVSTSYIVLNSVVLLVLGIVGMTLRRNPHRQWLLISLFVGMLMVTAGHTGPVEGWFGASVRDALDHALAPLRNVHKFDPIIRVPMVLGLAHLIAVMAEQSAPALTRVRERRARSDGAVGERLAAVGVLMLCAVAITGAAGPALVGKLGQANGFVAIPDYWQETATWLDQNSDDTTALLVPGSSFGFYIWGDPDDEPMQPLASTPWAVRDAVPLAPPGNIRMLDTIEDQLSSGRPSPGLAAYLRRAGIGHLVVRNDLRTSDQPAPVLVHQALDGSPGLERVTDFGPKVGGRARINDDGEPIVVDDGWVDRYRAVEIYAVTGAEQAVVSTGSRYVVGGPESLLELNEVGLLGDEPSVLATDVPTGTAIDNLVLTDGLRRREANFSRIHEGRSATLASDEVGRRGAPALDYTLGSTRWETTAEILGARSVDASSSRAFADTQGPVDPGALPFAAFDGYTDTAWDSGDVSPIGEPWVGVTLTAPRVVPEVRVVLADSGASDAVRLRVETDRGHSAEVRALPGSPVTIKVPPGTTSQLRVRRMGSSAEPFVVAEVTVPGLDVDRTLVLPKVPATWGAPDSVLLSSTPGWREACVTVDDDVRCGAGKGSSGEEPGALDRTLRLGVGASYGVTAAVTTTDGSALQGLIQSKQLVNVAASSAAVRDARASAVAAIDGDPGTTWTADPDDDDPRLTVSWLAERTVSSITASLDRQAPGARPTRVVLEYAGGRQTVRLDATGHARVRPFRASRVAVRFVKVQKTQDLAPDGTREPLGVGVSELRLGGLGLLPITLSTQPVDLGCSFGPALRVGSALYPTSVTASPRELFDGGILPARVCGPERIDVAAGDTRVVLAPAPAFRGVRVVMKDRDVPAAVVTPADLSDDSPVSRVLTVPSGTTPTVAAVRENQNSGWEASVPGSGSASPVTIDGWQQGWVLTGPVERLDLTFTPDRLYRWALGVGGLLLVLLLVLAAVRRTWASDSPPVGPRRLSPVLLAGTGLVALGVMAGSGALLCGAAGVAVVVATRRWLDPDWMSWASGLLVALAGAVYWLRPLGSPDGWAGVLVAPQLLVAAALGVLLAVDLDPGPMSRSLKRIIGRSTSQ